MELKDVILGYLDWRQLTGYELKAMFSESDYLPWSGNNNQIYTALVELEKEGFVEKQVIQQEKLPAQKRYTTTAAGKIRLKAAVLKSCEPSQMRSDFLLHLAWSGCLTKEEAEKLIDNYQRQTETELAMCREKARRGSSQAARDEREEYVWAMIEQNRAMMLQTELNWLTQLRNGLAKKKKREVWNDGKHLQNGAEPASPLRLLSKRDRELAFPLPGMRSTHVLRQHAYASCGRTRQPGAGAAAWRRIQRVELGRGTARTVKYLPSHRPGYPRRGRLERSCEAQLGERRLYALAGRFPGRQGGSVRCLSRAVLRRVDRAEIRCEPTPACVADCPAGTGRGQPRPRFRRF